jgi:hypothetical protein
MNSRNLFASLSVIFCLGSLWATLAQRQQLSSLRAERARLATQGAAEDQNSVPVAPPEGATEHNAVQEPAVSPELLRLRNQVTQLSRRQRELAHVPKENEQLRAQLGTGGTNVASGTRLPLGFIRKSQAKLLGYNTPENTLQSFLWALQNRDETNLLHAFTPATAQQMVGRTEAFFKATDVLPGLALRGREELPDDSVELQVEMAPGIPLKFKLQQLNGEWKLVGPF